jgi:hypothetical protein
MAILDYSAGIRNAPNPAANMMGVAGQMQGLMQQKQGYNQREQVFNQQQDDRQNKQTALQEGVNLLQSDDYKAQASFMLKNPEVAQQFMGAMKFKDGAAMAERIDFNKKILSGSADPRPMIEERIKVVKAKGGDTENLEANLALGSDEEIRSELRKELSFLDSDALLKAESAQAGGAPMTDYQRAMVEGRKADRELTELKIAQTNAKTDLQKEKLGIEIDEKAAKLKDLKKGIKEKDIDREFQLTAIKDEGEGVLSLIDDIENHAGFAGYIGMQGWRTGFGAFEPVAGSPEADIKTKIQTLNAKNFLTGIAIFKEKGGAGALSDNEGKQLAAAITSLSNAQSEKGFRESLAVVKRLVNLGINRSTEKLEAKKASQAFQNATSEQKKYIKQLKAMKTTDAEISKALGL